METFLYIVIALSACALAALAVALPLSAQIKKLNRVTRGRLIEADRRAEERQARLTESVNAVLQLSANGIQNAENRTRDLSDRMEARMTDMLESNNRQLAEMRQMVDTQLTDALEKRLGASFEQVSSRLEEVHRGLGEMQSLAGSVGDLKKVLQGVKTRGIWGEAQLGALLREILSPGQYIENAAIVPGSQERVEFAVRLPGRDGEGLLLPIDSKFPLDVYSRLVDASESADRADIDRAGQELSRALLEQAKKIGDKYVKPPYSTDFALMFLPTESLYAEAVRRDELVETARTKHHVVIAGPSTLAALLNSLSLGFKTLSIERRTGEVWETLGALRTEFIRFGETLDRMRQRLDQASGELDSASARSRAITRRLNELEKTDENSGKK